jgi:hypothetical protein
MEGKNGSESSKLLNISLCAGISFAGRFGIVDSLTHKLIALGERANEINTIVFAPSRVSRLHN